MRAFWEICVSVPKDATTIDGRRQICFPVFVKETVNLGPKPPFLIHPEFDERQVKHLQALAAIDQLAEDLPGDAAHDIQRSVASQMQALGEQLGAGVKLSRHASAEYAASA